MKKIIIILVVIGLAIFAWWTISPLFIDKEVNDALPSDVVVEEQAVEEPVLENNNSIVDDTSTPTGPPQTNIEGPFAITGTTGHSADGNIKLVRASNETVVRYENYDGTNGPDLYVYLAKDLDAEEFVDLGRAKGNKGNINYTVPDDIDIDEYPYVLTWCKAFGVLFDYAEIN